MNNYKRLTERQGNLIVDKCKNCENYTNPMGCTDKQCYEIMRDRLCELEDKIENRTLFVLPCKVEDVVFKMSLKLLSQQEEITRLKAEIEKLREQKQ
jgi:hypothetical protein